MDPVEAEAPSVGIVGPLWGRGANIPAHYTLYPFRPIA